MHGQDDAKWTWFWTQGPFQQHPRRFGLACLAELGERRRKEQFSIRLCLGLFASRSVWSDKTLEELLPTAYKDHFLIDRLSGRGLLLWKCVKAETWGHCHCPPPIMKTRHVSAERQRGHQKPLGPKQEKK